MRKINIRLDDESHKILKIFQAENVLPNQEMALNMLIKEYARLKK
jgi:hypothetical protein